MPGWLQDFLNPKGIILLGTMVTFAVIFLVFTPYTHQLDELKNVLLMIIPPFLLAGVVSQMNPAVMRWRSHGALILLGLYIGAWWFSWLLNPYKVVGERVIWFQVGCSTFTLVFALTMNTEKMLRRVMSFMVGLCLLSCVIGLLFNYGRVGILFGPYLLDSLYDLMTSDPTWRMRENYASWVTLVNTLRKNREMYSTVLNSDFYAAYLVMMMPLCAAMVFVETKLWRRYMALIALLLSIICLYLTNSNDSYLGIALMSIPVFAILMSLYHSGIVLTKRFVLTFAGGMIVLAGVMFVLLLPRLINTWEFKTEAIRGREILWGGAWYAWLYFDDHTRSALNWLSIIFGTGPGGYRHYFPVQRMPEFFDNQINNVTTYAHNHFLDILLEIGLTGLVLFLLFHIVVVVQALRQIRTTKNPFFRMYQIALVSALAGIAVQHFFSPNSRWTVSGMTYWSLFGLSIGIWLAENPGRAVTGSVWEQSRIAPKVSYVLLIVLSGLFLFRSPRQGYTHWISATSNADGLRAMEYADYFAREVQALRSRASSDPNAMRMMQEREAARNKYLNDAIELFNKSIEYNPTFSTAYYKLGHVYSQAGNLLKALETYERLNAMSPNYSEIHQNLGIMYHMAATSPEMSDTSEKSLEYMEKSFQSISEGARQSLKPNVQSLAGRFGRTLARLYTDKGMPEKARQVREASKKFWRNIINYQPKLPEFAEERRTLLEGAWRELAQLGVDTGNTSETQQALRALYSIDPTNKTYLNQLIEFYDRAMSAEEKIKLLLELVEGNPIDVSLRRELAKAYALQGAREPYILELRRLEVFEPKDRSVLAALLLNYMAIGNHAKVLEYSDKLRNINVDPKIYDGSSTATVDIVRISQMPPEAVVRLRPNVATVRTTSGDRNNDRETTVPLPVATITIPITATVTMGDAQRTSPAADAAKAVATATPVPTPTPTPVPTPEVTPVPTPVPTPSPTPVAVQIAAETTATAPGIAPLSEPLSRTGGNVVVTTGAAHQ